MANPDYPYGFIPYSVQGFGGAVPTDVGQLEASTTIHKGDALIRNANGYIAPAAADSAAILGVAAHDATAGASEHPDVLFYPAIDDIVFCGQCSGTLTQALLGTSVDIEGSSGSMEINEDAASTVDSPTGVARLLRLKPGSELGANAEVLFVWAKSQYTG